MGDQTVPAATAVRHHAPHFTDKEVATRDVIAAADLLEAINALHQPLTFLSGRQQCSHDRKPWPCATVRLLHPVSFAFERNES